MLCRAIVQKFKIEGEGTVSYAEIARKAWEAGRVRLATMVSQSQDSRSNTGETGLMQ
jgi:hypothetical protein